MKNDDPLQASIDQKLLKSHTEYVFMKIVGM